MSREEEGFRFPLTLLAQWERITIELHEAAAQLGEPWSIAFEESRLGRAVRALEDFCTASISARVGDQGQWLNWWANETNFGQKPLEAKAANWPAPRPIEKLSDLLKIIES